MESNPSTIQNRFGGLDGLRGIAALVVLIHHSLLVYPTLSAAYFSEKVSDTFSRLLVFSPLHLFWAGTEAVYVFFVLSGFVLMQMYKSRSFTFKSYYPSRIVRLYGPTLFAVLIGAIIIFYTPTNLELTSRWMTNRSGFYSPTQFFYDFSLIFGVSGQITPLWSLQWEVIFSILLPIFVMLSKPKWFVSLALLSLSICFGALTQLWGFFYLPMFGIGILISTYWEIIQNTVENFLNNKRVFWGWAAVALSIILIDSRWIIGVFGDTFVSRALTMPFVLVGVSLLVILAGAWSPLVNLFQKKFFKWLGIISFSLYLVHEPVIIFFACLFGESIQATILGISVSLLLAQGFYMLIEKPIHLYSRRLRNRFS